MITDWLWVVVLFVVYFARFLLYFGYDAWVVGLIVCFGVLIVLGFCYGVALLLLIVLF